MESRSSTVNKRATVCPNCETAATGHPPGFLPNGSACQTEPDAPRFCSACGQRQQLTPLATREILATTLRNLSSFDGPVLRTLRDLLRGPGRVARAWIDGKRTSYIHPVSFLFVISLVIALSYEPLMDLRHSQHQPGTAIYTVGLEGIAPMFSLFGIALPLPVAWAIATLGRLAKLERPWLEWYVLGAYATGLGALLQLVFKLACLPLPTAWSGWLSLAEFLLPMMLLVWGAYHLVRPSRRWHAVVVTAVALPLLLAAFALLAT